MNKKIIIEGEKVHHVGYGPFLMAKAWELDIPSYFARNIRENGTERVEVSIGGKEEQLNEFIDFVKSNYPPEARVSKVREAEPPERIIPIEKYDRVLASEQHSTMVQTGLGMIEMQKKTLDKQDQTIDIIKEGDEKMLNKQDQTIEKTERMWLSLSGSDTCLNSVGIQPHCRYDTIPEI
ncbi:MAG: acylphosphatase [Candidatus Altiarchaeales archaeon]|nr:acylphosphatase [Candidatus Altiarchaeota archaeon]MCG2782123.1 acylphosphatase [Candidatus Altiarchaeales archaeon]